MLTYIIIAVLATLFVMPFIAVVAVGFGDPVAKVAKDPDAPAPQGDGHAPQCGAEPSQCGGSEQGHDLASESTPQGDGLRIHRANTALGALMQFWAQANDAPQCGGHAPQYGGSPKDLAETFRRTLQAQPALVAMAIAHEWVREAYPLFCRAERVEWPPPYKDFAHELAKQMPRIRKERWKDGKRILPTRTMYEVPVSTAAARKVRKPVGARAAFPRSSMPAQAAEYALVAQSNSAHSLR